ncbi:MAG: O-antigen ligase family protein [Bacteroidales bacterium]|jgi:hypothetical protein|nr:O-antigen ligase family protein [Bacteroidales bacterium]
MTRKTVHHCLYVVCLLVLAAAIPLSNYVMSIGGIFLFTNWVLEGNYRNKWNKLKANKLAIILLLFFFVLCFSFIRTQNWAYAFDNMLSKLPLFYAPLVMATSAPLSKREKLWVTGFFLAATFVGTVFGFTKWITGNYFNIREISFFISHIRFSICVAFAIILWIYLARHYMLQNRRWWAILPVAWLLFYMGIAQTLTGIFALGMVFIVYIIKLWNARLKNRFSLAFAAVSVVAILGGVCYLTVLIYHYCHVDKKMMAHLPTCTANGRLYEHDTASIIENGSPVFINVCTPELRSEWAKRSIVPYDSIADALVRFLNSKGSKKDSAGVAALTPKEVQLVEANIANKDYVNRWGLKASVYPILFSFSLYREQGKVAHSTLLQRVELWRASWQIIKRYPLLGVGMGDHKSELDKQLIADRSECTYRKRMGCHNQFLTYWLMGGAIPMLYFWVVLFIPFCLNKRFTTLYLLFFVLVFCSLFTEDTLETQPGITFYAFFNSFLLFVLEKKNGVHYSLRAIVGKTALFQLLKSPAKRCWRACVTKSRKK